MPNLISNLKGILIFIRVSLGVAGHLCSIVNYSSSHISIEHVINSASQ